MAGDGDGITGFQMDMKVENINTDIIAQALIQAKQGRIHILEQMAKCSPPPREALSEYAPALLQLQVWIHGCSLETHIYVYDAH